LLLAKGRNPPFSHFHPKCHFQIGFPSAL
jgi:hypothetical protein